MTKTTKSDIFQIIVPTMGKPSLLVPCIERILTHRCATELELVVVMNTNDEKAAAISHFQISGLVQAHNDVGDTPSIDLQWLDLGEPSGWTGAVNAGVAHIRDHLSPYVVIMNDDVLVTPGWADRLRAAMETDRIHLHGETVVYGPENLKREGHPIEGHGRLGMVGPVTNVASRSQQIEVPALQLPPGHGFTINGADVLDKFAEHYAAENHGAVLASSFLSGFCTTYRRECLLDLLEESESGGQWLLDPVFGVGGFDDDDVVCRAEIAGWGRAIAVDCYVHHLGHQTLDEHFPESGRGCANMVEFLQKWNDYTQRDQTMGAVYRVRVTTMNDLLMLRGSLLRVGQLCDSIGLLWTGNPAAITQSDDWQLGQLTPTDAKLVAQCSEAKDAEGVRKASEVWLQAIADECEREITTLSDVWEGGWNERDERNRSIELADELGVDWILSVDHDEIVEDRITRAHIERLMKHPDPNVMIYNIGWLNHWDSPRLCRVDPPWSAADYSGGMCGFRMWRRTAAASHKIQGGTDIGLHCGNSPDFGIHAKRVANFRMRHFGYMRHSDRMRKWEFYNKIDPNPSTHLTKGQASSGGYSHLVNEEGMKISPYISANGIAFSMLVYKDDQAFGLYYHLSRVFAVADQIVLVWTGKDAEPSPNIRALGDAFGVQWVHHPMADDLAACRNAGIDAVREMLDPSISWFFTMDDDEQYEKDFDAFVAIRRMAEVSDSFGWMFRFRNYRHNGEWNWSETTRMMRLDPFGIVRYSGRVHETVEKAFQVLQNEHGIHPQVRYAPFSVNHYGLIGDAEALQPKLEKYTQLLIEEIRENPQDPSAWTSLSLQYGNDGREGERDRCLAIACRHAGRGYLPFKCVADVALREAKANMTDALNRLAPAHPYHKIASAICQWLTDNAAEQPVGGDGSKGGTAIPEGFDLSELERLEEESRAPKNGSGNGVRIENLKTGGPALISLDASQPPGAGV